MSASCTDDLICDHCKAVVEPAWGHSYLTGVNDATYPFAYADGKFTSTNKANYTTSSYTYTASTAVNLSIDYSVSCHGYDEFLILKNGSTLYTYSGEKSGTLSISLAAGDRLVFRFSNDSYSSGSDSASFAITSQSAVAPCTQSMTCIVCKTVTPASGHNYVDCVCTICGVENITASGTCGANVTWRLLSSGKLIISGTGDMENYTYSTSAPWEIYRGSVKSVVIEDGVTSVGNYAFKSHSYLKDAVIGNSVITIGEGAFMYCDLSNVEIGNKVEVIGTDAFYYKFNLENVTLPETLTTIGKSAFSWCKNKLTSIDIPDSVTSIGVYAWKSPPTIPSSTGRSLCIR